MTKVPLRPVLGLLLFLLVFALAAEGFRQEPRFGWVLAGTLAAGAWLGWGLRQIWIYPRRLARAEALWAEGGSASEVAALLAEAPLATGELGYRIRLLGAMAHAALGYRDRAWLGVLRAQLARLPWWTRPLVASAFGRIPGQPSRRRLAWGGFLLRIAPRMARLRHLQGILRLRSGLEGDVDRAWAEFEATLPLAADDPLVLEDLMLAGLQQGHEELGERALALLVARHGDPRLPWDRGTPGIHLLRRGRPAEALALVQGLPPERRADPTPWLVEGIAHRQLGDREGAWRIVEEGLARFPEAFRLWMERHQIALDLRLDEEALRSLERAWDAIPEEAGSGILREEWNLRRAEFAFWWEDHPEFARELLDKVPPGRRGSHHPPLHLQVQVALGEYEAAYAEIRNLLQRAPGDTDLLLLQADCLAGLDAWEALRPYLDGLGEACRERAAFWHLRGLALANLGDPLAARIDLERAAHMDPGDLRHLLDAGHACAELGEWQRAEAHWRQALQTDRRSEEALIHLAEARRELEDPDGARRYLRECLLHHPESEDAQTRLAELEAN